MKRVIIIDALNMFLRAYIVDPSLSSNGQPIGGLKGSIKILQKLVRISQPDSIVIVWDGPNGSQKRKNIDKNYKAGRKPIRLNRSFHNLTDNEELQNRIWQQTIQEVIEFCENSANKLKFFTGIVEGRALIEHNYRMMQLYSPMLSINSKDFVKTAVVDFECSFNKTGIIKKMREDGFGELNWEELRTRLNNIAVSC